MRRTTPQKESESPTLAPYQAIERIKTQLSKIDEIISLRHDDPKIEGWESTTVAVLDAAFGKPNGEPDRRTREFLRATNHVFYAGMSASKWQQSHVEGHEKRRALLLAFIEQLEFLAPPAAATAHDRYRVHPEIERISEDLYLTVTTNKLRSKPISG